MSDTGLKLFAGAASCVVNGVLLGGMLVAGMFGESEAAVDAPLDYVEVEVMPLPAKGVEPDPKALPRIVQAPEPEPETDVAGFKPKEEAEELEKKKKDEKKRQLAEEKRRQEEEEKRLLEEKAKLEKKKERERKKAMARALRKVNDARADEDNPDGFEDGNPNGTSTDPNSLRERSAYVSLVELVLSRQFPELGAIPPNERKRLRATVHFKIDATGKVLGQARLVKKSGNDLFDNEAVRTVMKFSGGGLKVPVPKESQRDLRKFVLAKGITARMRAQK